MTNSHRHGFGGIGDGDGTVKRIATKNKEKGVGGTTRRRRSRKMRKSMRGGENSWRCGDGDTEEVE